MPRCKGPPMACPPGMILNPHTLRCISSRGRIARDLVKAGDIDAGELRYGVGYGEPARRRQTAKAPRLYAYEPGPRPALVTLPGAQPQPQYPTHAVLRAGCPPGFEQNPRTGRCIRIGGRTFKRIYQGAGEAPVLGKAAMAPPRLPLGAAAPRPLVQSAQPVPPSLDRLGALSWVSDNCRNVTDPLTRTAFMSASSDNLREVLRLHDGTCTFAGPLNTLVTTEHKAGRIVPIPGSIDNTPMTVEDFTVLRDTMRRRDPAYKLPPRRHAPPPPEWRLYVASDKQSGPDYATVGFVDTTKGRRTSYGVTYTPDAFRVNMGVIPLSVPSVRGSCSVRVLVEILQRLATANKLLVPTAGGWRAIGGFPFTKAQWEDGHAPQRLGRLCKDLARALTEVV